jgi:hypothetical protein
MEVKKPRVQSAGIGGGVVKIVGQSQLPQEFITIGKNFEEALGRCTLRDDAQKNAIIIYKAQLSMFGMTDEIQDLTNLLNASAAVGGFNRSLAAMTYTQIYVPEGAGIKVSKENQKALMEMQRQRAASRGKDLDDNRENGNGNHRQ